LKIGRGKMRIASDSIFEFATSAEFGNWLAENHAKTGEIWMKIYKKSSGFASVTWAEAIIEALAWGWIDGIKKANDDNSWFQRFTPRKPRSIWSKRNCDLAEKLIADGRMKDAGLKTVLAARSDGRWDRAYAGSSTPEFSRAFSAEIAHHPNARKNFSKLSRAELFQIYFRLQTSKNEETRRKIIKTVIEMLSRGNMAAST
jgi:uncharacterized protein YdeI (YjbR/CyaY-like superfamily)